MPPASPFDRPYDALEALPRTVWLPTLVAAVGTRERRLSDVRGWLSALQAGELPDTQLDFGDPSSLAPLRAAVGELALPSLARGVPSLAEQVLRTLLWHLDRIVDLQPRLTREQAVAQVSTEFREAWKTDTAGLDSELQLLHQLADAAHLQWDRLGGQLRSREWQTARRAAERLQRLPALAALLQRLGRSEPRPTAPPRPRPEPGAASSSVPMRPLETRLSGAPGEVTGIRFGSRLERMLPGEAALLRHPVGRRLWQARHAEQRLLEHDSEAVLIDWRPDPQAAPAPEQTLVAPLAHGPLLLCLDTSGSMRGAPEHIAKAVALAAVRTAREAGRACRLIAFGGPGELIERDLTGPGGLDALLALMGQGFDGGTDVQTPIERCVELVHDAPWRSADLLIVSDGEFGCVPDTLQRLDEARESLGLAVHGILVGDRETLGLMQVCDEIHWVRDWRRHADADDGAAGMRAETLQALPVHSKSLTALYFPNALTGRAARHRVG
jgi:uncharacterized protein with von Willebrand factor type A (vWA) domain